MSLTFRHAPRISKAHFKSILEKATTAGPSPWAPIANELYDIITASGLDPACLLAIGAKESQYGVTGLAPKTKNFGNVRTAFHPELASGHDDVHNFAVYATWQDSLRDLVDRLNVRYIDKGLTTPEAIFPVYAPPTENDTAGYINFVNAHVQKWMNEDQAMAFSWDPKLWTTLADFKAYLATQTPAPWLKGLTFHHTAAPTRDQWQGMTHMKNLGVYYRDTLGWSAGPHLFLAADTAHNGVFQGTPLNTIGVHAGPCNSDHLGLEIVGNYSEEPWPPAVAELVYGVLGALATWAAIPTNRVQGHKECMPGHTACPGTKIDPGAVRIELARRLGGLIDYKAAWGALHPDIAYNASFGIPTLWRAELDAGRPLGAVLTPELYNASAVVVQEFERGWILYNQSTKKTSVLR